MINWNLSTFLGIIFSIIQILAGISCIFKSVQTKNKALLYLGIAAIIMGTFYLVDVSLGH